MAKGYILRTDSVIWEPIQIGGYEDLRDAIGGYISSIGVASYATVYCHDEGKLIPLPPTAAWVEPATGTIVDIICGPIVLLGPPDDEGDDTDMNPGILEEAKTHFVVLPLHERSQIIPPEPHMTIIPLDGDDDISRFFGYRR